MKKLIIICFVIICSLGLYGQSVNETDPQSLNRIAHSFKDVSVSLSGNMLFNNPYETVFAGGLKMKVFVDKRISFDADLLAGKDYLHFGPGIIGLPLLLFSDEIRFSSEEKGSFGLFLFSITMMVLSAEHIAYHFPIGNNNEFSPFVSILRFKQLNVHENTNTAEDNALHASFVTGIEFNRYYKRFVVSPYLEYNVAYDGYFRGLNLGINIGYYFPNRNKEVRNN